MELLMPFQTCCSVLVQPSCFTLPHIPWLSGVAVVQANPPTNSADGCLATGTASGAATGSVAVWQPSVRSTTPIIPRTGYLIADLSWISSSDGPRWAGAVGIPQLARVEVSRRPVKAAPSACTGRAG